MSAPPGWYPDPNVPGQLRFWSGAAWTEQTSAVATPAAGSPGFARQDSGLQPQPAAVAPAQTQASVEQPSEIRSEIDRLKRELIETRGLMLLQEVGLYEYHHPLDSSAKYKQALVDLRAQLKALVRSGDAVSSAKRWAVNGSEKEGAKMLADFSKLMLRSYNAEAEAAVKTLRPHGLGTTLKRLDKTRATVARLCSSMSIEITNRYHGLRVKELEMTADYLQKVQEEKDAAKEERERLREEATARKEFEREQERLEKERTHYETALAALEKRGDSAAAAETRAKLEEVQRALKGVIDRSANIRAGYVYVISNLGAFGEDIVKIGMTRRLEPLDRVRELGDASVPFRFDVHALIFSDDAVGLEGSLHKHFADRRLNLVNVRREFFRATPIEVKEALTQLKGDLLTFDEDAEAMEWRQSEAERRRSRAAATEVLPPTAG